MEDKILIFKPSKKALFKKSPHYTLPIFARAMAVVTAFLARSMSSLVDASTTDKYIDEFWRVQFESSRTRLYVTGREKFERGETYVVMSNHESWMDIPALFGAVPPSLRMVSKIGLMQVPILGRAMANGGFIFVDRKNRSRAIRQLERAKERLAEGISVWIAPEGTRSRDGTIGPFKKGGFYLARELNKPILPVFIEGAREVMPPDGLWVRPNRSITVHFCDPIPAIEIGTLDTNTLVHMVRERIIAKQRECLDQIRETE
jgi:1-acyl-sn-glycerol-3-phosphate acyltransferase